MAPGWWPCHCHLSLGWWDRCQPTSTPFSRTPFTLPPIPQQQSGLAAAHEGSQSSQPHSRPDLVSSRPWPCIFGVTPPVYPHPGGFWPGSSSPSLHPSGQRRRATRAPLQPRPKLRPGASVTTPHALCPPPARPTPSLEALRKNTHREARSVGMRSENRRGRDAHGALGCAETPGGQGRRAWPGRVRRRGSGRAGPGPWHGAAAARWVPPSVRGGWICRQPERFILLHSCQAAGAVLQLRHPFGLLLVSLPAPRLALGHIRLRLGCAAAPQVRPWAAHGYPSAALGTFPSLSPAPRSCPPPCAAAAAAGPDPRSMGALITLGLGGCGG